MRAYFLPIRKSLDLLSSRERWVFWTLISARTLANLLDIIALAGVGLFAALLGALYSGDSSVRLAGFEFPALNPNATYLLLVGIAGLFVMKSGFSAFLLRSSAYFLARVDARAAQEALEFIFGSGLDRVRSFSEAKLRWTVVNSVSMAFSNLLANFGALITEGSLFVFVFVAFAVTSWQTAVVVSAYFVLLLIGFQFFISLRLRAAGQSLANTDKKITALVLDMHGAFREIFSSGKIGRYFEVFKQDRALQANTWARIRLLEGSPRYFVEAALMVGVVGLVSGQLISGTFYDGILITTIFLAGGVRVMGALLPLQNALSWIRLNGPQAFEAHEVLEARKMSTASARNYTSNESLSGPKTATTLVDIPAPEIVVSGVDYFYPVSREPAIKNLSFKLYPGEYVAIVGPSGAGKSTVADLILGLIRPTKGSISIDGLAPEVYRRKFPGAVSYVPQRPGMLMGSLAMNVALEVDDREINHDRVENLLDLVGLKGQLSEREELSLSDNETKGQFSGGQSQRIGLARALYSDPNVLVLDEATSALDAESEKEVAELIHRLRGKVTLVVIAHRLSTVKRADRLLLLKDGGLLATGSFTELRQSQPLFQKFIEFSDLS